MAMTVAESLKRFRKAFRLSQKDVAIALGTSQQSYQAYETRSNPSVTVITKLADTYNVSTDYLLGRSDMPQPTNFDEKEVKAAFAFRDAWQQASGAWQKVMQMLPTPTNVAEQTAAK